jgi:hypothetical protein
MGAVCLSFLQVTHHRFVVHGLAAAVRCAVPELSARIERDLESLAVASWPAGTTPVCGTIAPYCIDEVQRQLPAQATLVGRTEHNAEIYRADERFWIIDDQRGIAEINPLRGTWRSWILADQGWFPATQSAPLEFALIWPAAQLLRNRELFILPAVSLAREGWGMLVICPFGLSSDIQPMVAAGFRLIGPRWTAMREEDDRLSLLYLPGTVQQTCSAAKRLLATRIQSIGNKPRQIPLDDIAATGMAAAQHQNFCDAVLVVEPTRRPVPQLRAVPTAHAPAALRRAWPMTELHPHRRQGRLPALLARHCQIFEAQLTPDPKHLLRFANAMRLGLAEGLAVQSCSGENASAKAGAAAVVVSTAPLVRRRAGAAFAPSAVPAPVASAPSGMAARIAPHHQSVAGLYRQRLTGRIRPPASAASAETPAKRAAPPWSKAG